MDIKKTVNFIFELNMLKRLKGSGWMLAGIKDPGSIAEHKLRAAQIGYILAVMEGCGNPEKVVTMLMLHDNSETRLGDQNKVAAKYIDKKQAQKEAFEEQISGLGKDIESAWKQYFKEFNERNTSEGIIARDADWLETAFEAKEYVDKGYGWAQNWINNVSKAVETKSAKKLIKEMEKTKFTDWWKNLKKMTYKKL